MKKILFALAIMPLLVMGCSSDDDDNTPNVDFGYNIELLYGEWRATSVEIMEGLEIDLTDPEIEENVEPTYITFKENNVYTSKGVLGKGSGTYITKDKTITTSLGDEKISFEMTSLDTKTATIELDPQDADFGVDIPEMIKTVTVTLTKQAKE